MGIKVVTLNHPRGSTNPRKLGVEGFVGLQQKNEKGVDQIPRGMTTVVLLQVKNGAKNAKRVPKDARRRWYPNQTMVRCPLTTRSLKTKDQKNKRWAICDEKLEKVIGEKRFKCFGMAKYLKEHM